MLYLYAIVVGRGAQYNRSVTSLHSKEKSGLAYFLGQMTTVRPTSASYLDRLAITIRPVLQSFLFIWSKFLALLKLLFR